MLHDALARGEQWAVSVVYSARTADEFAYGDELRALAKTRRIQLWQTVTREPAEAWTGRRGRIALHHLEEMVQDPETLCFVCGPHALVEDVPRLLQQAGVAPGSDQDRRLGQVSDGREPTRVGRIARLRGPIAM